MQTRHNRTKIYLLGAAGGIIAFFSAIVVASVSGFGDFDTAFPIVTVLATVGTALLATVGVSVATYRWPDKLLLTTAAVLLIAATIARPLYFRPQDTLILFTPAMVFPVGIILGTPALMIATFRMLKDRHGGSPHR